MADELDQLKRAFGALTERVERLEREPHPSVATTPVAPAGDEAQFWALNGLRERLDDHHSTADGAVMIVGSLTLPDGSPVAWQQGAGSSGLIDSDWSELAIAFGALGHPVRVELVRLILSGVHETAELAQAAEVGTTGQLHHHLRQLVSAGWVRQSGRGAYEVAAARIVPLLACVIGAAR